MKARLTRKNHPLECAGEAGSIQHAARLAPRHSPKAGTDREHTPNPDSESANRPEKVKRAKELIADPSYPPRAVLQKVAEKLIRRAKSWR